MESLTLHRAMVEAVDAHDLTALRALLHRDFRGSGGDWATRGGPDAAVARVHALLRAFPDLWIEDLRAHRVHEHRSVVEFTLRGTHRGPFDDVPATGRTVRVAACTVVETHEDRILRERSYLDTHGILCQLGAL